MTHTNALAGTRTRIRIAHDKTVKNGWGHSTCVEFEFDGEMDLDDACARIADLLDRADTKGRQESERRTALDAGEAGS